MSILFECAYEGERLVGVDRPVPGRSQTMHRLADGGLAALVAGGVDPSQLPALVAEEGAPVEVRADASVRYLPPLLPADEGSALVSGFMKTHHTKNLDAAAPDETNRYPQWFFKGFGSWLRVPGESMTVPATAVALIEEPEVVLVYVGGPDGTPHYAGYTFGNDLCDIGLHRRNPIYNSYCKLCDTSVLPWLFVDEPPKSVTGRTSIERDGAAAWSGSFDCGLDALHFTVETMPDHLLSFPALRRPGLVNYVFLGADEASFHDGFRIADGDRISIEVTSHDVTLTNTVSFG